MASRKLPKLYSARQYAAKIGIKYERMIRWLKDGRLPDAVKLPIGWVIPEGATVYVAGTDIDVPPEFLLGPIDPLEEPEYKGLKGHKEPPNRRTVSAEGMRAVRKELELSKRQVSQITGVSRETVLRMERGQPVWVDSVRKVSRGLDVPIEDLLRIPMYIPEGV